MPKQKKKTKPNGPTKALDVRHRHTYMSAFRYFLLVVEWAAVRVSLSRTESEIQVFKTADAYARLGSVRTRTLRGNENNGLKII